MNTEEIAKTNLFAGLTADEIEQILTSVQVSESTYPKGSILAMQDEPCNRLIFLLKGSVKAEMTDPSGKIVKVEDIEAPNPLAPLFLFGKESRFPVQVTTRENVTALIIPKGSVLKMLRMHEQLLQNYLDISAYYASALSKKLHLMSFRTIRQKIIIYLLNLPEEKANQVELDRTQHALAEYFGVSRPALARELRNMQDDGLIELEKKMVRFVNKPKLVQLIRF
ncbi:Crp/Fnr family transcriptional regulator [Massilibacteroides vaginae]|uniref:Crp/Fnr family transcriptional regulator n=1 Tax=Massilibacteroides vaginae TaxID=1673718 RepID=UPI000A1CD304|nr:Crp/Fnr family transcriptional regulator [Massilibacteroides vaginae]